MIRNNRGAAFKHKHHPVIVELNKAGYTSDNLHRLLRCTKGYSYKIINDPDRLTVAQLKAICFGINKSLGWVLNNLLFIPARSGNWLDDDFNPVERIEQLKKG